MIHWNKVDCVSFLAPMINHSYNDAIIQNHVAMCTSTTSIRPSVPSDRTKSTMCVSAIARQRPTLRRIMMHIQRRELQDN